MGKREIRDRIGPLAYIQNVSAVEKNRMATMNGQ